MIQDALNAILHEFSDLSLIQATQLMVRLTVAAIMGGVLGWERERAGKAAGLRTHILVAVGSAAFVAIPQQTGISSDGLTPILEGLIAGIGFLGAGCIMQETRNGQVKGLTTAAGIWLTAGVGVAAGMGRDASAVLLGGFGYFTLAVLGRLEFWMSPNRPTTEEANDPPQKPD